MTGLLNVQTPRSPQGLKGEIFLIFSEPDQEIGEKLHESLMREGFTVAEKPEGLEGTARQEALRKTIDQAGTVLYLASTDTQKSDFCQEELGLALASNKRIVPIILETVPSQARLSPAILPAIDFTHYGNETKYGRSFKELVREIRQGGPGVTGRPKMSPVARDQAKPKAISRQLTIWRSLFAATTIGLIALAAVSGTLYQRYQSVGGDLRVATEQKDLAIAARDLAIEQRDSAIAAREEMNDKLYVANVHADRAREAKEQALAARQEMNDKLYVANVHADRAREAKEQALAERKEMNDQLYAANVKADQAIEGEREAVNRIKQLQQELDKYEQRVEWLEGLLSRPPASRSPN